MENQPAAHKKEINIIKYLSELADRLSRLKDGVFMNNGIWKSFNITPETIDGHIREICKAGTEIEELKKTLSMKFSEARSIRQSKKKVIEQIEKRAIGLHADETEKLSGYGISSKI